MSVWRDMAKDAGYRGDEAEQVARMLEEEERRKVEEREADRCESDLEDELGGSR